MPSTLNSHLARNRYVLFADILAVALAAWCAFALRFGWMFMGTRPEFVLFVSAAIVVKVLVFQGFGLYRRFWRYASFWDLMAVVVANSVASVILGFIIVGARLADVIPALSRSVLPVDWLLGLALTTGVRASIRVLAETAAPRGATREGRLRRALIVGAGDAGALVAREMQKNPELGMVPVAFLDDEPAKLDKRIYGVPVLGGLPDLKSVVDARRVDEVVIAMPKAGGSVVRKVAESCRELGMPSQIMPGIYELLDSKAGIGRLREVDIADLLRRPQVRTEAASAKYLEGCTVVVTGAGGSIGSELCRQVAHSRPQRLVLLGHGENSIFQIAGELRARFPHVPIQSVIADVRDRDRIHKVFQSVSPTIVFHAAAHKHVALMEENSCEAIANNVLGTRNVVDAAHAAGVPRLVLISTDKAVAPTSVMGATKRICEMIVRDAARRRDRAYVVVRFGNVLGSRGSVVPIFKEQIERGGPVTVRHPEVRRFFMTIPEAVHLVLEAGGIGRGGELFVLDMGEPVLLRDLAADMIRLSGLTEEEVPIVFTGLHHGEKIDEELWEAGSDVAPAALPEIRIVSEPEPLANDRFAAAIDAMIDAAARDDRNRVIRLLSECIPTATLKPLPDSWEAAKLPARVLDIGSGA